MDSAGDDDMKLGLPMFSEHLLLATSTSTVVLFAVSLIELGEFSTFLFLLFSYLQFNS